MTGEKLLTELKPGTPPYIVINAMQQSSKMTGMTLEEIEAATGLNHNQVAHSLRLLSKWFSNIGVQKREGAFKLSYRPIGNGSPTTLIAATLQPSSKQLATLKAIRRADDKISDSEQRTVSKETEVVMPPAPSIPNVKEKYWYFDPPEWYPALKSKLLTHSKSIRLAGPPGIGKSVAPEYLAASEFIPLVSIGAEAGLRGRQLIGGMTDLGRFEVAQFAAAVINGWWCKVDEVNGADPDAILFLNSILAAPYEITVHGRSYSVHPDFRLIVTYNPGLVGTKPLPDSLKDRLYPFRVKFPTRSRLEKMLKANGVPVNEDSATMVEFALAVAEERDQRKHGFDITIRRLLDAYTDLQDGISPYWALYNSCIGGIDSNTDANAVLRILDAKVKKS